jgi:hypothetical protein
MDEPKVKRMVPPEGGSGVQRARAPREDDRAWVQISRKVNLGRYDMLEVGCGATVTVDPGETLAEALKRVEADVRREHAELLEALREDSGV